MSIVPMTSVVRDSTTRAVSIVGSSSIGSIVRISRERASSPALMLGGATSFSPIEPMTLERTAVSAPSAPSSSSSSLSRSSPNAAIAAFRSPLVTSAPSSRFSSGSEATSASR